MKDTHSKIDAFARDCAARVASVRRFRGIPQSVVANVLGRTQGHVSNLENGTCPLTVGELGRIAECLQVSPSVFLAPIIFDALPEFKPRARRRANRK